MIILIKSESEIGYKITLERVEVEKDVELELEEIGEEEFDDGGMGMRDNESEKFLNFLNFHFLD